MQITHSIRPTPSCYFRLAQSRCCYPWQLRNEGRLPSVTSRVAAVYNVADLGAHLSKPLWKIGRLVARTQGSDGQEFAIRLNEQREKLHLPPTSNHCLTVECEAARQE